MAGPPIPRILRRLRSLRVRAFIVVVVVAALPLLLVLLVNSNEEGADRRMLANTAAAVREARSLIADGGVGDNNAAALRDVAFRHHVRLRVVNAEGVVVVDVDEEAGRGVFYALGAVFFGPDGAPSLAGFETSLPALPHRGEVLALRTNRAATSQTRCDLVAERRLLVCIAAGSAARGEAHYVVHAAESSRRAVRALYDLRYQLLKLLVVSLPAALLLAWWLGWRMVRPLEQLRRQVQQRAHDRNPAPVDVTRADEFGDLGNSFNELLTRLHDHRVQNAGLVADLAHEFKNPVAAIRAAAEQLEGYVDVVRAARLGVVIGESARRLDGLVSEFLLLARAEAGLEGEAREDVAVNALVEALVARTREDVRAADKEIAAAAVGRFFCSGVPLQLERAIGNLIDNAVSFADKRIDVSVNTEPTGATTEDIVIVVADDGPGIAAVDLPRIFERFFTTRAGNGTDSAGGRGGTGLGLAFARAVFEAHGGTLTAATGTPTPTATAARTTTPATTPATMPRGAVFTARLPKLPRRS